MGQKAKRIVHIDDDQEILEAVKMLLESEGYEMHCFSSPEQGRDYILQNSADLILCDVRMPGLDGFEIYQSFRKKNSETPFVFYSGYFEYERRVESYDLDERVFFLPKPSFDITEEIKRFMSYKSTKH